MTKNSLVFNNEGQMGHLNHRKHLSLYLKNQSRKAETPADARFKQGRPFVKLNDELIQQAVSKTNPSGGGFN